MVHPEFPEGPACFGAVFFDMPLSYSVDIVDIASGLINWDDASVFF